MLIERPCAPANGNVIVINLICLDDKDKGRLYKVLNKSDAVEYEEFLLNDNDRISIHRNEDYLEPNAESKANRF